MPTKEELEIAKFAKGISNQLDSIMAGGQDAMPMPQAPGMAPVPRPRTNAKVTTNTNINAKNFVEAPVSRELAPEVHGTEAVNVNELMIGTDGMDEKMLEAINAYQNAPMPTAPQHTPNIPTGPHEVPPTPTITVPSQVTTPPPPKVTQTGPTSWTTSPDFVTLQEQLNRIEEKLDMIIQRAKFIPKARYTKKK